jgi:protocatechuate 3,4-dioxygenase beta subunit
VYVYGSHLHPLQVFPGWYAGRTVHIHLKVHPPDFHPSSSSSDLLPRTLETTNASHAQTTQLFFPQEINDHVAHLEPYNSSAVYRVRNDQDHQFIEMRNASVVKVKWGEDGRMKAQVAVGVDRWW